MSDFLRTLLVFFAAINPAAVWLAVGARVEGQPHRLATAGTAAVVAGLIVVVGAVGSAAALNALDVEPETFRTSAGIVMASMGVQAIWRADIPYDTEQSWKDGIFPVGIPIIAGPAMIVAAVTYADYTGTWQTVTGGLVIVLASAAAVAWLPRRLDVAYEIVARLSGALLIVFAVAIVVSGVKDV